MRKEENAVPDESLTLGEAVKRLSAHYGSPASLPTTDPFELILWENVAYLASPERRREAFERLKQTIGATPEAIVAAEPRDLERVTAAGILKSTFAAKLLACASIALEKFDGDLDAVVRGPIDKAKRALRSFPGIGEPGAEKILLFTGRQPMLAPESNGLRVLVRLGLVPDDKSYARMYAASRKAASGLSAEPCVVQKAHLLLQQHGQTLCKRGTPLCGQCPLALGCVYARLNHIAVDESSPPPSQTKKPTPRKRRGG
jgi:endonuclease III